MEFDFLLGASRKARRQNLRHFLRRRYSANLIVDVGGTGLFPPSCVNANSPLSGAQVGTVVDLNNADTFCNIWVAGGATSGIAAVQIQTTDVTSGQLSSGGLQAIVTSGAFTDPTSGLAQLPTNISSGGILWVNSGLWSLPQGGGASGAMSVNTFGLGTNPVFGGQTPAGGSFPVSGSFTVFGSGGGMAFGAFQRPHRYARLNILAGSFSAPIIAGFLSQLRTTGSGGGFTFSPTSGAVNV